MGLRGPILATTDLSDASDVALRQAAAIAADLGAPLAICHVLPEAFHVRVLFPQDAGLDATAHEGLARRALTVVASRASATIDSVDTAAAIEIAFGSPHAGILEVAARVGAGLIVVGPGATAQRVARSATCPVLIARPSPAEGAVVGATDFSDPALPAVRMAAAEAQRRHAPLRVVHCLDLTPLASLATIGAPGLLPLASLPSMVFGEIESVAHQRLEEAIAAIGTPAEAVVLTMPPAVGILDMARGSATSLVVLGTRGRTGLARLALGSVAEDVSARAPCSVMVVPLD